MNRIFESTYIPQDCLRRSLLSTIVVYTLVMFLLISFFGSVHVYSQNIRNDTQETDATENKVVHSCTLPPQSVSSQTEEERIIGTCTLPKFDSARGELQSTFFDVEASVLGDIGVENTGSQIGQYIISSSITVTISDPSSQPTTSLQINTSQPVPLGAWDSQLDYSGASGSIVQLNESQQSQTEYTSSEQLSLFIASMPGVIETFDLLITARGATTVQSGSLQSDAVELFEAINLHQTIRVFYTFSTDITPKPNLTRTGGHNNRIAFSTLMFYYILFLSGVYYSIVEPK